MAEEEIDGEPVVADLVALARVKAALTFAGMAELAAQIGRLVDAHQETPAANAPIVRAWLAESATRQALRRRDLEDGLAAAGPPGAMRAMAEVLVARENESYVDPFYIGETFARAGMVDEALHWLENAARHGSYKMTYLGFWPHLDAVRDDPRYQVLLQRVYGERAQKIRQVSDAHRQQDR